MSTFSSTASCGQDALRVYVLPARRCLGPLPIELELAQAIREGDPDAIHALAKTADGLIAHFVRYYSRFCRSFTRADLWQEGQIALLIAAQRYDPVSHPVRFSTFAYRSLWWRFSRIAYHRDYLVRRRRGDPVWAQVAFDADQAEPDEPDDAWEDERIALERHLRHFPERTRHIIALRADGRTLGEIGFELGISKERVRQIEARTIREIKERARTE